MDQVVFLHTNILLGITCRRLDIFCPNGNGRKKHDL